MFGAILDKLGLSDKINIDEWYNTFLSLEKKQQILVSIGMVVVILIVLAMPVGCVSSKLGEREDEYDKYLKKASQFYGIQQEYQILKENFNKMKSSTDRLGSDPLKTILYEVVAEVGINQRSVTPKTINPVDQELFVEEGKDVKIQNVRFDQMVKALDKLLNNGKLPVSIKKLTAKGDKKDFKMLKTVTFTMTTLKAK